MGVSAGVACVRGLRVCERMVQTCVAKQMHLYIYARVHVHMCDGVDCQCLPCPWVRHFALALLLEVIAHHR